MKAAAISFDLAAFDRVCHEMRGPLTAIDAYSELLVDEVSGALNAEQQAQLAVVRAGVRTLDDLVGGLYQTFESMSGELRPQWGEHDLEQLLYDLADEYEESCVGRGVRLSVLTAGPVVHPHTDSVALARALRRGIDNALQYGADGGAIVLRLECDGHRARISVEDEGLGIPVEEHERVFDAFYRGERGSRVSAKGIGVGLTHCRAVLECLGGTAHVENRHPRGASLVLELPGVNTRKARTPGPTLQLTREGSS
jgi:K+-sensing histidine kinase KdpD